MKLLAGEIEKSKIIHNEYDEESSTVNDILINLDGKKICYLTLKLAKPAHEMDDEKSQGFLEMLNPFSHPEDTKKQHYYIPDSKIDEMKPGTVVMRGSKIEGERVEPLLDCRSYKLTLGTEVETIGGENLGIINDIVVDEATKGLVAFQLKKRTWDRVKYLPFEGKVDWHPDKLVVPDEMSERLVDELRLLF